MGARRAAGVTTATVVVACGVAVAAGVGWWAGPGAPHLSAEDRDALASVTTGLEVALSGRPRPTTTLMTRWVRQAAPSVRAGEGPRQGREVPTYAVVQPADEAPPSSDSPVVIAVWHIPGEDRTIVLDDDSPYRRVCAQLVVDAPRAALTAEPVRCPDGLPDFPPVSSPPIDPSDTTAGDEAPVVKVERLRTSGPLVRGSVRQADGPLYALLPAPGRSSTGQPHTPASGSVPAKGPYPCIDGDLALTVDTATTVLPREAVTVRAVNTSTTACRIDPVTALAPAGRGAATRVRTTTRRPVTTTRPAATAAVPTTGRGVPAGSVVLAPAQSATTEISWRPGPPDTAPRIGVLRTGNLETLIGPGAGLVDAFATAGSGAGHDATGWTDIGYGATPDDRSPDVAIAAPCTGDELAITTRHRRGTSNQTNTQPSRQSNAQTATQATTQDSSRSGSQSSSQASRHASGPTGKDGNASRGGAGRDVEAVGINIGASTCRLDPGRAPINPGLPYGQLDPDTTADQPETTGPVVLVPGAATVLGTVATAHPGQALIRGTWLPVQGTP